VKSAPLLAPGRSKPCLIRGRVDVLVDCDDGTKGIVDFKTTVPKPDHIATYGRQLHAYAMALEHPSGGKPEVVSSLGLLCFLPDTYEAEKGRAGLYGDVQWIEIPRDDLGFAEFLREVVEILDHPEPPPPTPGCSWCGHRESPCAAA
jgi:PD-(D/E)XK nuclease superfamily